MEAEALISINPAYSNPMRSISFDDPTICFKSNSFAADAFVDGLSPATKDGGAF
jgi:hypothetical protein